MKMIEYLYGGMLLISIALIYFANKNYYSTRELVNRGVKTTATVIDLMEIKGDDSSTYKPVFKYTDIRDKEHTFKSLVSSRPAPYKIGDQIQIMYSKNGEEIKIISFWGLYRGTIILLSIASPLLIISFGYFMYTNGYI